jgi:hypothetical protein
MSMKYRGVKMPKIRGTIMDTTERRARESVPFVYMMRVRHNRAIRPAPPEPARFTLQDRLATMPESERRLISRLRIVGAVVVAMSLSGCAELAARYEAAEANRCAQMGAPQGSADYLNCRMQLRQQSVELFNASVQLLNNSGPSRLPHGAYRLGPMITNCTTMGYQTHCVTP